MEEKNKPEIGENLKKRRGVMTEEEEEKLLDRILGDKNYDDESDDDIPYAGKVYLSRKKLPDSWACVGLQVFLVLAVFALIYYAYFHFEHMHVNVLHAYAHLGYDLAQHELGNRYLHGSSLVLMLYPIYLYLFNTNQNNLTFRSWR
jgi:hypothetical protein